MFQEPPPPVKAAEPPKVKKSKKASKSSKSSKKSKKSSKKSKTSKSSKKTSKASKTSKKAARKNQADYARNPKTAAEKPFVGTFTYPPADQGGSSFRAPKSDSNLNRPSGEGIKHPSSDKQPGSDRSKQTIIQMPTTPTPYDSARKGWSF